MATPKKEQSVSEIAELLKSSKAIILTDYRGMTMKDVDTLRTKLRPEKAVFRIVKNTLFRRAAEGTSFSQVDALLEGPTAAIFGLEDSVSPARLVADYVRETKGLIQIKGGVIEGQPCDAAAVAAIAKLPPRDTLIAQVVGGLQAPIAGLAGTLQTMLGSLVWTLQGVADQKA